MPYAWGQGGIYEQADPAIFSAGLVFFIAAGFFLKKYVDSRGGKRLTITQAEKAVTPINSSSLSMWTNSPSEAKNPPH